MSMIGRLFRAFGRKVICTCRDPERCPLFGEPRPPIRLTADLSNEISPAARTYIDNLPDVTIAVSFACKPGEHELLDITNFGDRHRRYLCARCSGTTACLKRDLSARHIANALDCPQCITEAEEAAP